MRRASDRGQLNLEGKPDAGKALERIEAWWARAVLDRPAFQVTAPLPGRSLAPPRPPYARLRDRWMDAEQAVREADHRIASTWWGGDILPAWFPNLGPEVLAAAYGAPLVFGEDTSWSEPILAEWDGLEALRFDPESECVRAILAMTRLALERGRGRWLVGITDLHPGGDLAASLRDPQRLCLDLLESPQQVHALMDRLRPSFYAFYDLQDSLIRRAGQPVCTTWFPLYARGRFYVPSCDFAGLVSPALFRQFFLREIVEEVEWLDHSIFHLDGPSALVHLDAILEIPKLDAVQFVCGAGDGPSSRWMDVYRRILAAGKGVHVTIEPWELETFLAELPPEGVLLCTHVPTPADGSAMIARVERWGARPGGRPLAQRTSPRPSRRG